MVFVHDECRMAGSRWSRPLGPNLSPATPAMVPFVHQSGQQHSGFTSSSCSHSNPWPQKRGLEPWFSNSDHASFSSMKIILAYCSYGCPVACGQQRESQADHQLLPCDTASRQKDPRGREAETIQPQVQGPEAQGLVFWELPHHTPTLSGCTTRTARRYCFFTCSGVTRSAILTGVQRLSPSHSTVCSVDRSARMFLSLPSIHSKSYRHQ